MYETGTMAAKGRQAIDRQSWKSDNGESKQRQHSYEPIQRLFRSFFHKQTLLKNQTHLYNVV